MLGEEVGDERQAFQTIESVRAKAATHENTWKSQGYKNIEAKIAAMAGNLGSSMCLKNFPFSVNYREPLNYFKKEAYIIILSF